MFLTTSFRRVLSVLVTLGTLLAAGLATAPAEAAPQPKTRWIVRFATQDAMRTVQASSDATAPGRARHVFRQAFPGVATSMTASQAARLRKLPGVLSVRPDRRIRAFDVQNNPPRGLDRVDQRTSQATRTYTSTKTGEGVTAYIVDSGINRAHTDFTGRLSSGPNYDLPGTPPDDCAGTAPTSPGSSPVPAMVWPRRPASCPSASWTAIPAASSPTRWRPWTGWWPTTPRASPPC